MKLPHLLFALLLAMCAVVVAAFFIEEVPFVEIAPEDGGPVVREYLGHGFDHPEFGAMQASGEGAERHARVLWLGLILGLLEIGFFLTCLVLGAQKNEKFGPLLRPVTIAGAIYAAIFTAIIVTYRGYATEDTHTLFLGLPTPTAWMVYGIWFFPFFFVLLYMHIFDSWTFTEEDAERFREIVAARRKAEAEES
ncbi:MAG: hypothetical protein IIB38_13265 [Candidatus Hydrogenedentes bacterium]|nr:hypothetical protein [Candidatus Hydrogenedentota bacterium]